MDKNKIFAVVAVVIIAAAAVGIGIYALNGNNSNGDIVDSRGRTISIDGDIDTIFCIDCCSLELVSYFDAMHKVCARDSNDAIIGNKIYTQVYSQFLSSLKVITVSNAEEIIALHPSVVISSTVSVEDLNREQTTYGVPVYGINADLEFGSEAWFVQITKLGILFKEESRAAEINNGIKDLIGDITSESVSDVSAYACGMMFYGAGNFLKTSGAGDYLPFTYSGVTNVMPSNPSGTGQPYNTTIEDIVATTFDYIFIDGSSVSTTTGQIKDYIGSSTLGNEPAIINGDVYKLMTYKVWGTQWDAQLINCFYVASVVNGSHYSWAFDDKANEVIDLLYSTDLTYDDLAALQTGGGCGQVTI